MSLYADMPRVLEDRNCGFWKIDHIYVSKDNWRALIDGIPSGEYVRLSHCGTCVMSDTPMEKRTNAKFVENAHGDILVGGLGIGMILLAIQDKKEVKSITVVEKSPEVIEMVASQLPLNEKVTIVNADVFTWKPSKGQKFDCVYMDIWDSINSDVYHEEMKPLKRKYGHYLKPKSESPNRFNFCWAEWNAKNDRPLR